MPYYTQQVRNFEARFFYDDQLLAPYQRRAAQKLDTILEQLDLGAEANLGYTKITWLPDAVARVRYTAMEGILEPIIVVRIEYQDTNEAQKAKRAATEPFTKEEEEEEEDYTDYIPYMWVGIGTFGHGNESVSENENCPWASFPTEARQYAFEPYYEVEEGSDDPPFSFLNCCEQLPGAIHGNNGRISSYWGENHEVFFPESNASKQLFVELCYGQWGDFNEAGQEQGSFNWQQWDLASSGVVNVAPNSGMMAARWIHTVLTAPDEAYEGIDPKYWYGSIVVDPSGHTFENGYYEHNFQISDTLGIDAFFYTEIDEGGTIPCKVVPGEYEIGCTAMNYPCECTTANLHMRLVLGKKPGPVTIVDIFPQGPGQSTTEHIQNQYRQAGLGGRVGWHDYTSSICYPEAGWGPDYYPFGGQSGGKGWWQDSLFVNVQHGSYEVREGTRRSPFFDTTCPDQQIFDAAHEQCVGGCVGDDTEAPMYDWGIPISNPIVTYQKGGKIDYVDMRNAVVFHMARVVQAHSETGAVCYVKLVGNDGAQCDDSVFAPKPCCRDCDYHHQGRWNNCEGECKPIAYGVTFRGLGLDPSINVFSNTPNYDPNWINLVGSGKGRGRYQPGQLCVVVGFLGTHGGECSRGIISGSGLPGVIVTTPQGSGQDFTQGSWSRYRCPEYDVTAGGKFSGHRAQPISYKEALARRVKCITNKDGSMSYEPDPFIMECGCVDGQFKCWDANDEDDAGAGS